MSDYQTLFDIQIAHDYFVGELCACLEYIPTDTTVRIMRNTGLVMRKSNHGFWVAFDRDYRDAMQLQLAETGEGLDLVFKVYTTDPQFRTYTEPFSESTQGVLYFTNRIMPSSANHKARLHAGKVVSTEDFLEVEAEELQGVLDRKDRLIPPVSVIRIHADQRSNPLFDKKNNAKSPSFTVQFTARRTYWKYFLQGNKADVDAFIFDPDGRVEFDATGPDRLADGSSVLTYRSKQSIPMNERFDFRFQLKQRKNGIDKVLYKQLPFARAGQTGKEVVAQQAIAVSEIYINY